jgi:hypothetical protein
MAEIPNGFHVSLPRFAEGLRAGALVECGCPGCRAKLLMALSIDMAEATEEDEPAAPLFDLIAAGAATAVSMGLEFDDFDRLVRKAFTNMLKQKAQNEGETVHTC